MDQLPSGIEVLAGSDRVSHVLTPVWSGRKVQIPRGSEAGASAREK